MNLLRLRISWLFVAMLMVSCAQHSAVVSRNSASNHQKSYEAVTNAINTGDWDALRKLTNPGMKARIQMWENSQRTEHAVRVGKLVSVDRDAELNGIRCTKYSFELENKDGTPNPHWLQVLVHEEGGRSEILDFWEFGW